MFRVSQTPLYSNPMKPRKEEKENEDEKDEKKERQQQPSKKPNIQMFSKIDLTYGIDVDSC